MLMKADRSCLVIVDVQEKLTPVMDDPRRVINGCTVLLRAAARLDIPVLIAEQYPQGLGPTMFDLREYAPEGATVTKTSYSVTEEPAFVERLDALGRDQVIMAGIETHVCVLQSALSLVDMGKEVFVVADSCSSRKPQSEELAHVRMRTAGVHLANVEMVIFEWLGKAGTPEFKELQALIR